MTLNIEVRQAPELARALAAETGETMTRAKAVRKPLLFKGDDFSKTDVETVPSRA